MLPTRPAMPRHKGKVESGINYGQENALKGRSLESLWAENLFHLDWESGVADTRIHGTTNSLKFASAAYSRGQQVAWPAVRAILENRPRLLLVRNTGCPRCCRTRAKAGWPSTRRGIR